MYGSPDKEILKTFPSDCPTVNAALITTVVIIVIISSEFVHVQLFIVSSTICVINNQVKKKHQNIHCY